MADEAKVLTPEEQKVADVKVAQKAEAAAAKAVKEREKFIAKLIKEGGKPACRDGGLGPFFPPPFLLWPPFLPPFKGPSCRLRSPTLKALLPPPSRQEGRRDRGRQRHGRPRLLLHDDGAAGGQH